MGMTTNQTALEQKLAKACRLSQAYSYRYSTGFMPGAYGGGNTIRMCPLCRKLARTEGLLSGGSTGTVLAGVLAWCERIPADAVVVR